MGSFEEEKLIEMVHDFMEYSESSPRRPLFSSSSNRLPLNNQTQYFTLQDILRSGAEYEADHQVLEIILNHLRNKRVLEKTSGVKKWLVMRLKMDGYNASLSQSSWVTSFGCPAGEYEYIEVMVEDQDSEPTRLVVDIDFKSQFELARPTPAYKQLTDTLPSIFVGTEDKLIKIISILCSEAKQSLKERGLHLPPWRTTSYMQSKWLSSSHNKDLNNFVGLKKKENNKEVKISANGFTKWVPPNPIVKPKRRDLGGDGSSGLSSQFSNMRINCC
ncbi:hypothetical protein FNV43_RR18853 [Rhamnella rubrinervis]|uniref:Uncharacterized protein n=1 Tax=Rhamnella rubrinervis TaxID=2594499 RepID=A0A8K0E724_9ROSA|nr:hypothetical protein FNV43_RR18853 [Rhamnella rubrinervis]